MTQEQKKYDIVVFGASGFTGGFVVEALVSIIEKRGDNVRLAIAGRCEQRMATRLMTRGLDHFDFSKLDMLFVDADSMFSIAEMVKSTGILVNCVGPYRLHGEAVVSACVENSTSYVDLAGEPEFIELMQLKYDKKAKQNNCTIVSACGFDSVPCDIGCSLMREAMVAKGYIPHTIETFLSVNGDYGTVFHSTTFECVVLGYQNAHKLRGIRSESTKNGQRPSVNLAGATKKMNTPGIFYDHRVPNLSCMIFPGSDRSVVTRTQQMLTLDHPCYESFQHQCYMTVADSIWTKLKLGIFQFLLSFLCKRKWGASLLINYPEIFTGGLFSHSGPSTKQLENTRFRFDIFGYAFSSKEYMEKNPEKPDVDMRSLVTGSEPGYVATSQIISHVAMSLFDDKSPKRGVITTGVLLKDNKDFVQNVGECGACKFSGSTRTN